MPWATASSRETRRDTDGERRALTCARAGDVDRAALPDDEVSYEREADAEAVVGPGDRRVRLRERLEHTSQELRRDPGSGIANAQLHRPAIAIERDGHRAALRRELDRVPEQIRRDLTQAARIGRDLRPRREFRLDRDPLGGRSGPRGLHRGLDD